MIETTLCANPLLDGERAGSADRPTRRTDEVGEGKGIAPAPDRAHPPRPSLSPTEREFGGRRRVAILISGHGSNMASLIEAARDPGYPAEIVAVISNRPGAGGLARAQEAGIAALAIDHKAFPDRLSFEQALDRTLRERNAELVCLAGFMRVFTPWFIEQWPGRMLNIHPSLLPLFKGVHTHRRALATGVLIHGCTAHFVVPELDSGPIIAQAAVPVFPGDNEDALAARVLVQEHVIYPKALRLVCEGNAALLGGRAVFHDGDGATPPNAALVACGGSALRE